MFAMYMKRFCTVLIKDQKGQALIQYSSGKQPQWVDKDLVKYIGGQASAN